MGLWQRIFRRRGTEKRPLEASMFDYEDSLAPVEPTGPVACPRCASRIMKIAKGDPILRCKGQVGRRRECNRWLTSKMPIERERVGGRCSSHEPEDYVVMLAEEDVWVCIGLEGRDEIDRFLAPEFPGGKAPAGVEHKDPCGWMDTDEGFGIDWV